MADAARVPASFEFACDGPVWKGIPVVNGHRLLHVTSADVHLDASSVPVVTLKLWASDAVKLGFTGADVMLDGETREALVSLGWTPPDSPLPAVTCPESWTAEQVADFEQRWAEVCGGKHALRWLPPGPGSDVHPCEVIPAGEAPHG